MSDAPDLQDFGPMELEPGCLRRCLGHGYLRSDVARFVVGPLFEELKREYGDNAAIGAFLEEVVEDLPGHIGDFAPDEEEPGDNGPGDDDDERPASRHERLDAESRRESLARYGVNVFVDNGDCHGAPVVFEHNPALPNLLGRIDYRSTFGALVTGFDQIKPGAIHRANGGFLILRAIDVLSTPSSWRSLERALLARRIEIEGTTDSEEPAKVILIGTPELHELLYELDPDLQVLFKVKVDFAPDMEWTAESRRDTSRFPGSRSPRSTPLSSSPECSGHSGARRQASCAARARPSQSVLRNEPS